MWTYLVLGATFAFAAAAQPGPLQTYLVNQSLLRGWKRTLPAAIAPLISDGPIMAVVLLLLTRVPPAFVRALHAAGAAFLLYLAIDAYRTWRGFHTSDRPPVGGRTQSLFGAVVVNLLNPNPYLGWSLVMGPTFLRGWRETPAHGIALLAGFYATMSAGLAATIFLASAAGRFGPRLRRALLGLSALALFGFAVYQIFVATLVHR